MTQTMESLKPLEAALDGAMTALRASVVSGTQLPDIDDPRAQSVRRTTTGT